MCIRAYMHTIFSHTPSIECSASSYNSIQFNPVASLKLSRHHPATAKTPWEKLVRERVLPKRKIPYLIKNQEKFIISSNSSSISSSIINQSSHQSSRQSFHQSSRQSSHQSSHQ